MPKLEGFWKGPGQTELPMPVEHGIPFPEKDDFVARLKSIQKRAQIIHFKGFSRCRICNKINGTTEYSYSGWNWPEGYLHYIVDHNVSPSVEFFNFVMNRKI